MSRAQVEKILGKPTSVDAVPPFSPAM